jgi:hypothetical protein
MRIAAPLTVLLLSATTLFIWFAVPAAGAHAAFGQAASALVLVAAMVASVTGAVVATPSAATSTKRGTAVALVALAVATIVLGFNHVSKSDSVPEMMLGLFLWIVAFALIGGAMTLLRVS